MTTHRIKRGLDLPITGAPEPVIEDGVRPAHVALIAADYVGMKPVMKVEVGTPVSIGQVLFEHKTLPGVRFTSPGAGTIAAIERGAKRALQSVVVRLDSRTNEARVTLSSFSGRHPSSLDRNHVRALLLESGCWTSLRARPFGGLARPDSVPSSIFVTAWDSEPLAPDLDLVVAGREDDLDRGLVASQG